MYCDTVYRWTHTPALCPAGLEQYSASQVAQQSGTTVVQ